MSVKLNNINVNLENELNEYLRENANNNGRVSTTSDPRAPSRTQSFYENPIFVNNKFINGRNSTVSKPKASRPQSFYKEVKQVVKNLPRKASRLLKRPSSPPLPFNELEKTNLYTLMSAYLSNPHPGDLPLIRNEAKRLGMNSPLVQTARSFAESIILNVYHKNTRKEEALINVLGGSILSSGGRRPTRKQRRKAKKHTRKH